MATAAATSQFAGVDFLNLDSLLSEEERTLFTGDHIMDGSTVVIAPPDGDMAAYLESLDPRQVKPRVAGRDVPGC